MFVYLLTTPETVIIIISLKTNFSFLPKAGQNDMTGAPRPKALLFFCFVLPRSGNYSLRLLKEAYGAHLQQGGQKMRGASLEDLKKALPTSKTFGKCLIVTEILPLL